MTPEAQRIRSEARADIIEALVDATGAVRRRLNATEEDLMMFCIYGLASFVESAPTPEEMVVTIIDLLTNIVGATMEAEITRDRSDA